MFSRSREKSSYPHLEACWTSDTETNLRELREASMETDASEKHLLCMCYERNEEESHTLIRERREGS